MGLVVCRVACLTALLSLAVTGTATAIVAVVFLALDTGHPEVVRVMTSCAIMCLTLPPIVLGPLASLTLRYRDFSAGLRDAALTDSLNGIPNRRAFFEHAAQRHGPLFCR